MRFCEIRNQPRPRALDPHDGRYPLFPGTAQRELLFPSRAVRDPFDSVGGSGGLG